MQIRRLNHISARRSSVGALPLVLALGATSASAAEREAPQITAAYANGPGAITLAWTHAGEGIFGFAVQVDGGGQWLDVQRLDHTFTQHTLVGLQPDTAFTLRVCAVYDEAGTERECSEPGVTVKTMPPDQPAAQGKPPTPRVVEHRVVGQTTVGIRWEAGYDYDSYFIHWVEKGQQGGQSMHHDDDGTWGYQDIGDLTPGRTYHFQVQGCTETAFGILDDHCWDWSSPYEVQLRLPPPSAPTQPVVTVSSVTERQINLKWDVVADERIRRTIVYRDGGAYYDVPQPLNLLEDGKIRPNTEYRYHVCLTNETDTTCSDPVTAMSKPVEPTPPTGVTAFRPVSGAPYVTLHWANSEIPGQFVRVERQDRTFSHQATGMTELIWSDLQRIVAKKDPTSATILEKDQLGVTEGDEYRVCAVVPPLGRAGTACSAPVALTQSPFLQDQIRRQFPRVPLHQ